MWRSSFLCNSIARLRLDVVLFYEYIGALFRFFGIKFIEILERMRKV